MVSLMIFAVLVSVYVVVFKRSCQNTNRKAKQSQVFCSRESAVSYFADGGVSILASNCQAANHNTRPKREALLRKDLGIERPLGFKSDP